jgi:hypothetical protein
MRHVFKALPDGFMHIVAGSYIEKLLAGFRVLHDGPFSFFHFGSRAACAASASRRSARLTDFASGKTAAKSGSIKTRFLPEVARA